ncbi:glutathione-disulfide reductase [Pararhizobium sp. IMCC21322]|uniref:glutathione-disulfide reductase n=1 Tax=Pararhizobium sp. IMCC21322 TaxID=3067903 RepID=UPI0027427D7F|nr:glutathione-disulfide reductase [Pararhizobium sp. IMCC21322]
MQEFDYDLFVIGAGSGGVRAARIASQYGARVAIAEEYRVGGTCVIRGCVPKKLFTYAAHYSEDFEDAAGYGWTVGETSFDWETLIANKDREIDRLNGIYITNLEKAGVEVFKTRATMRDRHSVYLVKEERHVTAKTILIATGGTPNFDPTIDGIEHTISSNEAFHLEELPKSIVIAGGGYIALEFACIFNGLGVDTTVIYRGEKVLRGFDDDVRDLVQQSMIDNGITIDLGDIFTKIEKTEVGLIGHTQKGKALKADQIMFAIGRSPNTDGLGLANIGIELNGKDAIKVDEYSRTSIDNIFAVGDVTDRVNLTPVAIREGHAVADNEFGGKDVIVDHTEIATAVFTTPEIGTVGISEEEAVATFASVDVYKSSFRPMKSILPGRNDKMLMKLIVDADTDRVVGCHIVGPAAGEMSQLVGIAVKMKATKADFDATMAVHPTAAEELVTMREPTTRHRRDG